MNKKEKILENRYKQLKYHKKLLKKIKKKKKKKLNYFN